MKNKTDNVRVISTTSNLFEGHNFLRGKDNSIEEMVRALISGIDLDIEYYNKVMVDTTVRKEMFGDHPFLSSRTLSRPLFRIDSTLVEDDEFTSSDVFLEIQINPLYHNGLVYPPGTRFYGSGKVVIPKDIFAVAFNSIEASSRFVCQDIYGFRHVEKFNGVDSTTEVITQKRQAIKEAASILGLTIPPPCDSSSKDEDSISGLITIRTYNFKKDDFDKSITNNILFTEQQTEEFFQLIIEGKADPRFAVYDTPMVELLNDKEDYAFVGIEGIRMQSLDEVESGTSVKHATSLLQIANPNIDLIKSSVFEMGDMSVFLCREQEILVEFLDRC